MPLGLAVIDDRKAFDLNRVIESILLTARRDPDSCGRQKISRGSDRRKHLPFDRETERCLTSSLVP